jgi:hypothetical protein
LRSWIENSIGDLPAVLMKRRHCEQLALTIMGDPSFQGCLPAGPMPRAQSTRDDEIHRRSDCLCLAESKHPLGRWIPVAHARRLALMRRRLRSHADCVGDAFIDGPTLRSEAAGHPPRWSRAGHDRSSTSLARHRAPPQGWHMGTMCQPDSMRSLCACSPEVDIADADPGCSVGTPGASVRRATLVRQPMRGTTRCLPYSEPDDFPRC